MTDIAVRIAKLILNCSNKSMMSKEKDIECQRNIDGRFVLPSVQLVLPSTV